MEKYLIDSYKSEECEKDTSTVQQPYGSPRQEKPSSGSVSDSSKKMKTEKHNFDRSEQEKNLLIRRDFSIEELFRNHKITLYDENKKVVYNKATKPRKNCKIMCGTICYSRWSQLDDCINLKLLPPERVASVSKPALSPRPRNLSKTNNMMNNAINTNASTTTVAMNGDAKGDETREINPTINPNANSGTILIEDSETSAMDLAHERQPEIHLKQFLEVEKLERVYQYKQSGETAMEWHVNFADEDLFVAYQGGLFAQDEIQVAEMPVLAHLKQALLKLYSQNEGYYNAKPKTKVSKDKSTPILIHGIERLCHVRLDKNSVEGRPQGLYGNHFARASPLAVAKATELLDDCKVNLICIASLSPSSGYYTQYQIHYLFACAYTAYFASVVETKRCGFEVSRAVNVSDFQHTNINTGNWGCGAFGGNLELTAVIQVLAALMAGVKKLRYYTFDKSGTDGLNKGLRIVHALINEKGNIAISDIIEILVTMKFKWGFSNGT